MIRICINGQWTEISEPASGESVLRQLGLLEKPLVAELNGLAMAKQAFMEQALADRDLLELVSIVGGG